MERKAFRMSHSSSNGFTIPELLVALVVSSILIFLLFGPLDDVYTANMNGLRDVVQASDIKTALRSVEKDVSLAVSFAKQNDANDPFGPDDNGVTTDTWSWQGLQSPDTQKRVFIIQTYATYIPVGLTDDGRMLAYNNSDCKTPLLNNYVYFVKNETLYRRLLTTTQTPCGATTVAQKRTCLPAKVGTYGCLASDAVILKNVTKFNIDYYMNPTTTSLTSTQYDTNSSLPLQAQTVVITIGTKDNTGSTRISRINGDVL